MYFFICLLAAILMIGIAFIYKSISEAAISSDINQLYKVSIIAIPYLIIEASFDYFPRKYRAIAVQNIIYDMRKDLVEVIMKESNNYDSNFSTEMTNKLVNDLEIIEQSYVTNILAMIFSLLIFFMSLTAAITLQGYLTFVMICLSFIPFLSPIISTKILADKKEKAQKSKKEYLLYFEELSDNINYINISKTFKHFTNILEKLNFNINKKNIEFKSSLGVTYAISYGLGNVIFSGTWIIGGLFVYKKLMSLPDLIAMTALMNTIAGPIQTITSQYSEIVSTKDIVSNYNKFIEMNKEIHTNDKTFSIDEIDSIKLNKYNLSILNRVVFQDVEYEFVKNKKYVLVGESGTGKTTLLKDVIGLSNISDKVLINGISLRNIDIQEFYDLIHYIPQNTVIFNATIEDNISLFKENNQEKMLKCLDSVGLIPWLNNQPQSLKTIIDGTKLSGGEKRRIDIARSLYKNSCQLIVMDEPTSGLDIENENIISKIISDMNNKTLIISTHSNNPNLLNIFDIKLSIADNNIKEINSLK